MEEIEYLEEYEDLILPMSFAVDDGKCNERLDGRKSIDSLEMLYKDLIEDTSLQQNQPDTSPFSLNPHMISPEKTILSSSTTVEIGLAQSFPNYSLNATPPAYVNATATDTLHAYQAQTPNIQYLNRATNKSFSSYSSLQKPDKLKSVATVKPTLQRVNNPPKQYIQRESPIFKTIIPGQPAPQSQHIFTKPSSTKTTFAVGSSSIVSKSKSALKISKLSAAGVDPLAGLDDDVLLDFDERNGLVDGFDFESDLDNSIIAGLSDMDSESVDLSDEFIDDNFDLESDLSSEGSDLKKILKRKRSQLSSQDSLERQNTKSVNDLKRDASNSVKKKLSLNNKHGSEGYNEKLPSTSSSVGRDPSIVVYSTKVNEVVANGNIFPHLSSKLNDLEQAHVSNVLNLTPTVPLYTKEGDKTESGLKQFVALTPTPNEKNNHQKKDERTHAIIDPFRGFPESFTSKPEEKQTGEVVKSNLNDLNLNKSPLKNTETSNQKDAPSDKPARLKFGSLYLRAIKPPSLKPSPIKTATIVLQQTNPCKTPTTSQPPKVTEESCKTAQKNISLTTATQNIVSNCPAINTVADVSKTLKALPSTPDATKIPEKWSSVPKILESKDKNPEPTENVRVMPQLKRHKSLGALNASLPGRESANIKNKDSSEKPKAHAQSRAQKIVNVIHESNSKKDTTLPQTHEGKKRDSITKPNVQIQSIKSSLSGAKAAQGAKKDDLSNVSKAQTQLKQKVHAEERITLKSEKTNTNVKSQDISDASKGQGQVKQKVNAEEKITSNAEKVNTVMKTQEHRDRFANEKSKVPSPPKLKCMDEKITAALEKSSTPNVHEVRVHDVSDKSEVQAQIRRRRFAVQRNRSKSANRTVDIQAPAADSKEINEKQLKAAQQSVEHKRLDAISTQSGDTHQMTEKMLLDKEPSLQQSHEASLENKITALVDEMPLPTKRRKVLESRKFNGRNSKRKESMNSPHAADPPSVQPTAEIAEKSKSEREAHKSVILPQANGTATVPQALQKDIPQKVPTSTPSSSRQTSKLSSNAKSESKLALLNLGPLKPLSSRKAISREQKKINLRQFKIRLNRKTVDHFMKSIKDVVSSTPTDTKNSDLNEFKSPLSVVGISKLVIPRSAGRPRKNFPTCLRSPHQNAEEKVVHSEPQAPVVSSLVPLPKLTQNEPEVEKNVSLEVQSCPTLKRRKRKKMRSNLPAKILRSDKTSSTDKSDISNKDCITDPVPQKEQCLADGSAHNTKATPAETLIPAVPAEATNLPVPKETSNSGEPASVIKPITSSVLQQCTTSPTVPTLANSPTFPTDAASPAMPTGNNSLKVVKAPSSESVPAKTAETSTSPNHLKERGRPYSKKNARRAAFARRLELIRASTSQRLPITPTPEEPTAEPAAVGKDTRLVNESIMIETNATASPDNSELSAQTIETAPSAASRTPIHSKKTKSLAASQTSVQVNETTSQSTPQSKKSKSLATSQTCPQTDETASQTSVHSKKTKSSSVSQPSDQINETASPAAPQTPVQTNKATSSNVQSKKTKSSQACVQTVEISSPSTFQSPLQTKKTPSSAASQPSVPVLETRSSAMSPPLPQPKSVTCQPPGPANETDSLATPQPSIQTQESATTEPLVQTKETTSLASQTPDGLHLTNLVQPKTEIGDPTSLNQAPDLGTTMFDGAPAVYSFARPRDTCRNSELFLDACQIAANSFATEQNGATESVAIYDLPSYIVMRTRIITRGELQKTGSAIPPQIKINKSPENGHAAPVFKEESPDFKDICLEINTLLGRNANYLKFASASERQARMNQVLSDSSLSVQEAESALKFLQSYLSARSKDVSVNNAKGQQFIPIYDSQKKVIGYRKRRVHPKKSPPSMEVTKKSGRLLIRSSNSSRSRTTSTICTTPVQQIVVEFSTKEEPQTIDAGDEELIVPDVSSVSTNAIKSEIES